ncbi:YhgE/Pip domain-containing protein [Alteribacter aurantiacus]|uniref:YhgE/Pip domain-containing protein n=1 Tax=Alteribacter aurantiacus TaxID=254410 RepID=UPI00040D23FD|nr:YhgE/Pip domain-containing protein [Alteribacter aurantiacus]
MKGLKHELGGILQRKKLLIALIGIMLMPLLYGGALIWSFWDPYGQIEDLPVAVVNEDQGAFVEGEELKAGEEFVETLKKDPSLDFHFVDNKTAREGMKNFDYYFYVLIPDTFSEDVASVIDSEPVKGTLLYEVNEDYNYVSSQIASTAIETMENELAEALTLAYIEVANDSFSSFTKKVLELEEGTDQIKRGNEDAFEGGESLFEAVVKINQGAGDLSEGSSELNEGVTTLKNEWQSVVHAVEEADELEGAKGSFFTVRETTGEIEKLLQNGEFEKASQQFDHWFSQAADLEQSVSQINDSLQDGKEKLITIEERLKKTEETFQTVVVDVDERRNELGEGYEEKKQRIDEIEESLLEVEQLLKEPIETLEDVENHYEALPDYLDEHWPEWYENDEVVSWYERGQKQFEDVPLLQSSLHDQMENINNRVHDLRESVTAGEDRVDAFLTNVEEAFDLIEETTVDIERMVGVLDDVDQSLDTFEQALQSLEKMDEQVNPDDIEQDLHESLQKVNEGLTTLEDAYGVAVQRSEQVTNGLGELSEGANRVHDGAYSLSDNLTDAEEASERLVNGLDDLAEGSSELNDRVTDVSAFTNELDPGHQHEMMLSSPVESLSTQSKSDYSYGEGLTPYFLSIGLYVGALTLSIIFPFREPLGPHANGTQWFFGKFGVVLIVGFVQVSILLLFILFGLNLDVSSPGAFVGFAYLVSFVFMSMIFMLVGVLDNPGRFVAIILLILQLGGSGGTFPVELLASPLQSLHGWLPMTYSVLGFRSVIFMDSPVLLGQSVLFLISVAAIVLAIAFFFYVKRYKKLCLPSIDQSKEQTNA